MNFIGQGILGFILVLNNFFNDFGLALIFFTLILKIILLPIDFLTFLEEEKLKRLRPKIKEIMEKYKKDMYKQSQALLELYTEENYNPFKTLIIQFLPLPIIFSIFIVLQGLLKTNLELIFLNSINLKSKDIGLAFVVIILQFLFIYKLPPDQRKISFFIFGVLILALIQLPAIFSLYWITNILLTLIERYIFNIYLVKFSTQSIPKQDS